MIRREEGFTLVELMITMVVFVLVIAAASSIFSSLLNQFKQQSKIIESNVEGVVGLEMMRVDVQQAGFGLPWFVETGGSEDGLDPWVLDGYFEAAGADNADRTDPSYYNDGDTASAIPAPATQRAPRAVLAENDAGPVLGTGYRSDYLVVKSTSIGLAEAAQKWTYVTNNNGVYVTADWNDANRHEPSEEPESTDWVITERPVIGAPQRVLVMAAPPAFSTQFGPNGNSVFQPELDAETHLIYGVGTVEPRAPFNRSDFFVAAPADMPAKCAPNTGILYKAVMNQGDGGLQRLPLLDCVADMQVVFITDPDSDPATPPEWSDADFPYTGGLTAEQIRAQVTGVAVYILAQEGQRDPNFSFNNFSDCNGDGAPDANCILVGDFFDGALRGRAFDLSLIGPDFANYRWKIYHFAVYPPNLKGQ